MKVLNGKRWTLGSLALLAIALGGARPAAAQDSSMQETPSVLLPGLYLEDARRPLAIGQPAPAVILPPCELSPLFKKTTEVRLEDVLRSGGHRATLVVYWAFWCDTWKDMTRVLNQMKPQLEQAGIQVVVVAVDASQQPVARTAFESRQIWWPVLIDVKGEAGEKWGVRRVPSLFLVDKSGTIRQVWEGFPGKQTFWRESAKALGIEVPRVKVGK